MKKNNSITIIFVLTFSLFCSTLSAKPELQKPQVSNDADNKDLKTLLYDDFSDKTLQQWEVLPGTNYELKNGYLILKESPFNVRPVYGYYYGLKSKLKISEGTITVKISCNNDYWSHFVGKFNSDNESFVFWIDPLAQKVELRRAYTYYATLGLSEPVSFNKNEWHELKVVITKDRYQSYWDGKKIFDMEGKKEYKESSNEMSIILGGVLCRGSEIIFDEIKIETTK